MTKELIEPPLGVVSCIFVSVFFFNSKLFIIPFLFYREEASSFIGVTNGVLSEWIGEFKPSFQPKVFFPILSYIEVSCCFIEEVN